MEHDPGLKRMDLLALAKAAGVKGRSKMTKQQLIEALSGLEKASGGMQDRTPASEQPSLAVPVPVPPPAEGPPELSSLLGEHRLALLPQGPRAAFAYWETLEEGFADLILKVVTAPEETEIARYDVKGRAGSYYIHLDRGGVQIEVVLGTLKGGHFHQILRSNRIRLPDDSPSEDLPQFWMTRRDGILEISPLARDLALRGGTWGSLEDRSGGQPGSSQFFGRGKVFP